uniref:Alpha-(1,3)-fucosyltransferase FucT N-terminal domain-containing protein n=1 Tax=viral metagenome TaxID=1070528 RepID=A0A6C0BIX2_9ZZZZ
MRIGITFSPEAPLWSSGANQTALVLAELFSTFHEILLVNRTHSDTEWFADYEKPSYLTVSSLTHASGLDWLIDIDGIIREEDRKRISAHTIVFLRTFLQFAEMDASVYMDYPYVGRSMDVHEIWCWDVLNPEDTIPSIQTLFPCPIRRVPFIWSPTFLKERTPCSSPRDEWIVHVAEKNNNSSSSIIPLVAIRELTKTHHVEATYQIHNIDTIKEYRFLKENILTNIEADTLPLSFAPKEPWTHWSQNSIMLSHSRFVPLRPSLLQLLWLGIPLVHNSPVLSELHPQLQNMYYPGNNIKELCSAMKGLMAHSEPWFAAHTEIRDTIMTRFGIASNRERWATILHDVWGAKLLEKTVDRPLNTPLETPKEIIIAFSDMWPGFNHNSNFIMDALRHEAPTLSMKGVSYSLSITPSLVICGPYSTSWKQIPSVPKVYFSGENWEVPNDPSISLYITSSTNEDDRHLRIPTWMTFINWFTTSSELPHGCTDNPIRLPVQLALQPHPIPFDKRQQFCAFVVSNPTCAIRNEAFHHVNTYKKVNSGGGLYNNIGGQLELKYPGGGCGDLSKHAFFSQHQFTLSFENSQASGYITEKVLHAKMAGCVPLYWGTQTDSDFVPNSFINLSSIQSAEQVVEILKKLEARPDMCAAIAATPILDEQRRQKAIRMMSVMSQRILALVGRKSLDHIDRIDKTFVINLDSRRDRWESLLQSEPQLQGLVTRVPAVYGKTLQMTSSIFKLYKNNPFQWKKSIIGCYLSHLLIWKQILKEEGHLFLILEDDVRFQKGWMEQWKAAARDMPEDAELMYWGGVLPPNKKVLPLVSETVNDHWARIRPNTMFSTIALPLFHFCTYSYLLTKAGAQKLIQYTMSLDGMPFPGCDHLLGHSSLKTYLTAPLLTTCSQEDDPVYVHSQFDNLHREDTFDSDIWNNKECFSDEELAPFYKSMTVYYMTDTEPYELYEKLWLDDMFQCDIQCVSYSSTLFSSLPEGAWIIFQRPFISVWNTLLSSHKQSFRILHLSDEFEMDDISLYSHPYCKGVIRNYPRANVPDTSYLITIPLGYHHRCTMKKSMEERKWVWSFHGTNWFQRGEQLKAFLSYEPHSYHLQPEWNHSSGTPCAEYLEILGNSQFCPILKGNHMETFRLYEALEAGTLPLFGPTISSSYLEWIKQYVDVSTIYDWTSMESMTMSLEKKEQARIEIGRQWKIWKENIQKSCQMLL